MLGTLHHLDNHEQALRSAIGAVRPGGWIALDEAVSRHHLARRFRQLAGLKEEVQSAHNESVDPAVIARCVADAAETVVDVRLYSPLRAVLAHLLSGAMDSRPLLTRQVLVLDALCLRALGRFSFFEGRELLVLARKNAAGSALHPDDASIAA
jgi:hypothetical protein